MRCSFPIAVFASLWLLLSLAQAQKEVWSLLPNCAHDCLNSSILATPCDPYTSTDASCTCRGVNLLTQAEACFGRQCSRKETLHALNVTSIACDKPTRDKTKTYRVVNLTFTSIALVAIITQWVIRGTVGRLQWLDDGNMVALLVANMVLFGTCIKMSYTGLGRDMWEVSFDKITTTLLLFWVSEIAYFATIGFIKLSFLLFFLQIFPKKNFRRIVWAVIYFQVASMIAFCLAATFVCSPIRFAWLQWDNEHTGKCINNNTLAFTHAAHSIFVDFITLSLPLTQIWKLHLALKKKIGVLLMFSVGAFVTTVSIIRLRALVHFANTTNMTWDYLEASLWSVIECQVGIVCTCMPSLRLGLTRLFPKLLGSTNRSTKDVTGPSKHGHSQSILKANEISVQTTYKVSHSRKPQTDGDDGSFIQLVDVDVDTKSARSTAS